MAIEKFVGLTIKVTYPGDDEASANSFTQDVSGAISTLLRVVGQGTANVWTATAPRATELEAAQRVLDMLDQMNGAGQ